MNIDSQIRNARFEDKSQITHLITHGERDLRGKTENLNELNYNIELLPSEFTAFLPRKGRAFVPASSLPLCAWSLLSLLLPGSDMLLARC